jgi:hypothetical protein
MSAKLAEVLHMSPSADFGQKPPAVEVLDTAGLAAKLHVVPSWVRSHVQPRCPQEERIPHLRLGRYVRFLWGSAELAAWLESRKVR